MECRSGAWPETRTTTSEDEGRGGVVGGGGGGTIMKWRRGRMKVVRFIVQLMRELFRGFR